MKKGSIPLILLVPLFLLFLPGEGAFSFQRPSEEAGGGAPRRPIWSGEVVEHFNSDIYTYVRVDLDGSDEEVWMAAFRFDVKPGDSIELYQGNKYTDLYSERLDRTFETIYTGWEIKVNDVPYSFGAHTEATKQATEKIRKSKILELDGLAPAPGEIPEEEGLLSIGMLLAGKAEYEGTEVVIAAKVVRKSTIGEETAMLLMDGTGPSTLNYVTVKDFEEVAVGDVVKMKGTLQFDVMRGFGHALPIVLNDPVLLRK